MGSDRERLTGWALVLLILTLVRDQVVTWVQAISRDESVRSTAQPSDWRADC